MHLIGHYAHVIDVYIPFQTPVAVQPTFDLSFVSVLHDNVTHILATKGWTSWMALPFLMSRFRTRLERHLLQMALRPDPNEYLPMICILLVAESCDPLSSSPPHSATRIWGH